MTFAKTLKAKRSMLAGALRDIYEGWRWHELWLTLGWKDLLSRHRRSRLGPFWNTFGMLFVAGGVGSLYGGIMGHPIHEYIPYLVIGYMTWGFLAALVIEGKDCFVSNAPSIREIPVPTSVYIYRLIWKNLLIFGFNAIIYFALLLIFQIWPFPAMLLAIPALFLILLNGVWVGLLLGLINVRYRDFGALIPNAIRLAFFVTPILWYADSVSGLRSAFVYFNPFYYFIELLRAPLLGQVPSQLVWLVVIAITAVGWLGTLPIYANWRQRIAFWV